MLIVPEPAYINEEAGAINMLISEAGVINMLISKGTGAINMLIIPESAFPY